MVRTTGGIRISAGKSSKKGGGGGSTRSASSTIGGKSSSRGSSRLPPIPHCEAPSWQKPITNFFNVGASSSKDAKPDEEKSQNLNDKDENKENESNIMDESDKMVTKDAEQENEDEDEAERFDNISGIEPLENNEVE